MNDSKQIIRFEQIYNNTNAPINNKHIHLSSSFLVEDKLNDTDFSYINFCYYYLHCCFLRMDPI